jgi:two-component system response regulator HydG
MRTHPTRTEPSMLAALRRLFPGGTADQFLDPLLDGLPCGIFAIDLDGRITAWNRQMEALTGFERDDVLGQGCEVLDGSTCGGGPCPVGGDGPCALFRDGGVRDRRCTIRTRGGEQIPVLKSAQMVLDTTGSPLGAFETVTDLRTVERLEADLEALRRTVAAVEGTRGLIGGHPSMARLREIIALAAATEASVLVQGETGTGKELVARAIHDASPRRGGPFVRVACCALSESLLESELFGHVRGAFTGAVSGRVGRFEAADGGTIFLDEIGDISPALQAKLLRVLQEREFERVGDNRTVKVDIRVVTATNRDLAALCREGRFRQDLYYRLAVMPLVVPPLRERRSDIPLLVAHFLDRLAARAGRPVPRLTAPALAALVDAPWPGNVRELEHALEYAWVLSPQGFIEALALPAAVSSPATAFSTMPDGPGGGEGAVEPTSPARRRKAAGPGRAVLEATLGAHGGSCTKTAEALGVHRVTLWKWLRAAGLG